MHCHGSYVAPWLMGRPVKPGDDTGEVVFQLSAKQGPVWWI
jgi:hypothetical protein